VVEGEKEDKSGVTLWEGGKRPVHEMKAIKAPETRARGGKKNKQSIHISLEEADRIHDIYLSTSRAKSKHILSETS